MGLPVPKKMAAHLRCHFLYAKTGVIINMCLEIPFWKKYTLSVEEAAAYFRIGENKIRKIISEEKDADYILWNGNRPQIKRVQFEKYIDRCNAV